MDFSERLGWLVLGCAIGFVLGYIVRSLRDIKEELDLVDEHVKTGLPCITRADNGKRRRKDDGYSIPGILGNIALFVVVMLTLWAAVASQRASNKSDNSLEKTDRVAVCNQQSLLKTIEALNERTTFNRQQALANVELQTAQGVFFSLILEEPRPSEKIRRDAALVYLSALQEFVKASRTAETKAVLNPFPTSEELQQCVDPNPFPTKKEPLND